MTVQRSDKRLIRTSEDIVMVRQLVREWAKTIGMNLVDQTKLITAASELARNTFDYGGGGVMLIEQVIDAMKIGLRLTFEDKGPGIDDVEQAIKDGYTTGGGMGLGLGGARRLANEFYIDTKPGEGTRVTIIRWK
ncbi:MAG: anti-sigma regulatory factor [Ignavibacteria bacterium]|jgi:serine/threonine-protein kinase RsbT|nr:anti-sigma regulatory factor [Ignavibacteria bacterium]MCU7504720.1 anti-sigma regulatory factor [Ignavibacteria bacterium]MCU7516322.1 anti-sigma regulatory factor [Ignavibacteria bacterium]